MALKEKESEKKNLNILPKLLDLNILQHTGFFV